MAEIEDVDVAEGADVLDGSIGEVEGVDVLERVDDGGDGHSAVL